MSECEILPNIVNSVGLVFDILGVVILFFTVSVQGRSGGAGAAGERAAASRVGPVLVRAGAGLRPPVVRAAAPGDGAGSVVRCLAIP